MKVNKDIITALNQLIRDDFSKHPDKDLIVIHQPNVESLINNLESLDYQNDAAQQQAKELTEKINHLCNLEIMKQITINEKSMDRWFKSALKFVKEIAHKAEDHAKLIKIDTYPIRLPKNLVKHFQESFPSSMIEVPPEFQEEETPVSTPMFSMLRKGSLAETLSRVSTFFRKNSDSKNEDNDDKIDNTPVNCKITTARIIRAIVLFNLGEYQLVSTCDESVLAKVPQDHLLNAIMFNLRAFGPEEKSSLEISESMGKTPQIENEDSDVEPIYIEKTKIPAQDLLTKLAFKKTPCIIKACQESESSPLLDAKFADTFHAAIATAEKMHKLCEIKEKKLKKFAEQVAKEAAPKVAPIASAPPEEATKEIVAKVAINETKNQQNNFNTVQPQNEKSLVVAPKKADKKARKKKKNDNNPVSHLKPIEIKKKPMFMYNNKIRRHVFSAAGYLDTHEAPVVNSKKLMKKLYPSK